MTKQYTDTPEQASQVARFALPLASKLGLPVSPHVYAVCYQYTAKLNSELCKAFDTLIRNHPTPDKLLVESLYQEHIETDDSEAVEILNSAVNSLVNTAEGVLQSAEDSTVAYDENLSHAVETLDHFDDSPEILKGIVKELLDDTSKMKSNTQELRAQLAFAREEAAELQAKYMRIREESLTDPLTGISNRRAFEHAFEDLVEKSHMSNGPLCLLVLDIDFFKKINDGFGHAVGDAVLKCIGKILKNSVRGDDVAARFGGEEFTVLLPDTPLDGAMKVAEKIRKVVAAQSLRYSNKDLGQITISIGISEKTPEDNMATLFERADGALYHAKDSGRNKVCFK